jgi:hypothetical protein
MELVKVKLDNPYIRRFPYPTDKYKVISINLKINEYNLNTFVGINEFKITYEWMPFSCSVNMVWTNG